MTHINLCAQQQGCTGTSPTKALWHVLAGVSLLQYPCSSILAAVSLQQSLEPAQLPPLQKLQCIVGAQPQCGPRAYLCRPNTLLLCFYWFRLKRRGG
jgi:hypothetical protein